MESTWTRYSSMVRESFLVPFNVFALRLYWHNRFPNASVCLGMRPSNDTPLDISVGDGTKAAMIKMLGCIKGGTYKLDIGKRSIIQGGVVMIISRTREYGNPTESTGEKTGYIKIGDDVLIGINAIIMPNVTIGNGATVGAGAVVLNNVRPGDVVTGSPAVSVKGKGKTARGLTIV